MARSPPGLWPSSPWGSWNSPFLFLPGLPRHSPPQCKSRSSWRSGSACGALNSSEWLTSPAPTGYRVGSGRGVRHSFYENAKRDLIKETHRRKKKKRQFALKRNRSMNFLNHLARDLPMWIQKTGQGVSQRGLCRASLVLQWKFWVDSGLGISDRFTVAGSPFCAMQVSLFCSEPVLPCVRAWSTFGGRVESQAGLSRWIKQPRYEVL